MKTILLYQSNDISMQLCLCITLNKGYISNNYFCKSSNQHLNVIFYCKLSQLILGGILFKKLNNPLWGLFSYFGTRVSTPNDQSFLPFVILPSYFCSYFSFLAFSYILFSYLDVAIFNNIMKFGFNLFP